MRSFGNDPFLGRSPGRLALLLLALWLGLAVADPARAQAVFTDDTFYGKFGAGYAEYTGELPAGTRRSPFDLRGMAGGRGTPILFTGELGYQFSPQFALALGFQGGRYPFVGLQRANGTRRVWRYTFQLLGRHRFRRPDRIVIPYLDGGVNVTFGENLRPRNTGVGPTLGAGLDILLSRVLSFYVESRFNLTFPDEAIDRVGPSDGSFDMVNQLLGVGFNVRFSTSTAPEVIDVNGPTTVQAGEPATFTATVNADAAKHPLSYQWQLGNGEQKSGRTITHTYNRPGTYTIRISASNEAGESSRSLSIAVEHPPDPASIASLQAKPNAVSEGQSVHFSSGVEGDPPFTYDWRFGDGTTASGRAPTHTYDEPGRYTARLKVSNEAGTDVDTTTVRVRKAPSTACTTIRELNPVFFEPGTSTLSDSARSALRENAEILSTCPNLTALVEGFAAPDEQIPKELSQKRSQAIENFYAAHGINEGRIFALGQGRVEVPEKAEQTRQHRRAVTLPLRGRTPGGTTSASVEGTSPSSSTLASASTSPQQSQAKASEPSSENSSNAGRWTIVIASLSEKERAQALAQRYRDRLRAESLPVETVKAKLKQETRHRVVVGQFEDVSAVKQALDKYEAKLPPKAWPLKLADADPAQEVAFGGVALPSERPSSASSSASTGESRVSASDSPSRPSSDFGRWTIVVASLSEKEGAQALVRRHRGRFSESFPVAIAKAELKQSTRYRVAVGRFEDADAVKKALDKYEAKLPSEAWPLRLQSARAARMRAEAASDAAKTNLGQET